MWDDIRGRNPEQLGVRTDSAPIRSIPPPGWVFLCTNAGDDVPSHCSLGL
ncbi:MAG: hypothetical protein J07HX64_00341 [halophilic archaeon J07HX64]|nr:MAG: hypothetical protein J07HX64_00341 [halophilic archaeon J07HX64]